MGDRLKIMAENYISEELLANFFYSSQNSGYPANNIQDIFRSKVWRSGNNFELSSNENIIVINDGSNKIIEIPFGTYTPITLSTQIQTTLNTASSGFTVSYSYTSYKFTISRTTNFSILWSDTSNTIYNLLGFQNTLDDTGSNSYTSDEARICYPAEWLTFDIGILDNPGAIILIDNKDAVIPIQSFVNMKLQANISNTWIDHEEISLTYDQNLIGHINTNGLFSDNKRFFRLYIPDINNPKGFIQIGKVYLGYVYEIESSDIQREFPETFVDLSTIERAISGEIYADEKSFYSVFGTIQINLCNKNDVDYIKKVWEEHKTFTPFFVAFDSELKATNTLSEWTKYVRFTAPPEFQTVTCNVWNITMQLEEVL